MSKLDFGGRSMEIRDMDGAGLDTVFREQFDKALEGESDWIAKIALSDNGLSLSIHTMHDRDDKHLKQRQPKTPEMIREAGKTLGILLEALKPGFGCHGEDAVGLALARGYEFCLGETDARQDLLPGDPRNVVVFVTQGRAQYIMVTRDPR